ncbi:spermine synthase-like isoform X1 [Branchiostoma lanceolatum]|uniref:spermine synthase-like isoform X1 n=1 Tax=Branchiostoma lanceolatum TaxID=7740 RepID=UPI00345561CA
MPAYNLLLDFQVAPTILETSENGKATSNQEMHNVVRSLGLQGPVSAVTFQDGGTFAVFHNEGGSHATLRVYPQGLVTLDVQQWVEEGGEPKITEESLKDVEQKFRRVLSSKKSKRLPFIKRGMRLDPYITTTSEQIVEYDFDRVVYEENSPYQNIKILHSPQYGNLLLLDDDQNLAESDAAYTYAMTGNGREDFMNKDVLILGGGDGGILYHLLQQNPKFVTMLEIDQMVIDAATKYLRGICHDCFDSLSGDNYLVRVEDCVPVLEQYAQDGKTFDYVINDLTDIPISQEPTVFSLSAEDTCDLPQKILDLSLKVLKKTGKYWTHGANTNNVPQKFEEQLKHLLPPVDFLKEVIAIPSYHELWAFYTIWKAS